MRKLKASVTLSLAMRDGETEEQAKDRLYDLMYGGLCSNAEYDGHDCDFWIEETHEEEE